MGRRSASLLLRRHEAKRSGGRAHRALQNDDPEIRDLEDATVTHQSQKQVGRFQAQVTRSASST